jgi:hypothetical protein
MKKRPPISMENNWCGGTRLSPQQFGKAKTRNITVQVSLVKKQEPVSKITRAKRAGSMAPVVKHPLHKHVSPEFKPQ